MNVQLKLSIRMIIKCDSNSMKLSMLIAGIKRVLERNHQSGVG